MSTQEKRGKKNVIALGLDYNYNYKNGGKTWTPKDGLKVYFLTLRLRVNISHEVCLELVASLKAHKHVKQMLLSLEKENAVGPTTHHVHAIVHFTENVPKPTFKQWMDRFVAKHYRKDQGAVKFDYHPKAAIDVRTCFCIKDEYLTKHETSDHYVGLDEFDLGAATDELPTQDMQTLLETHKPDRVVNAVWTTYCAQWTEYAPDDGSIESCWKWYNDGVYSSSIEGMSDPRKQTQFVELLHRFRNKTWEFAAHQIRSINAVKAAWCDDANTDEYVLKVKSKKRKHGVQEEVQVQPQNSHEGDGQ